MNYLDLSKEVSYALRHAPWEYELELDEEGWVEKKQLLHSLRENKKWENLKEDDLRRMINNSDKKRHEIFEGRIRALYGHSTPYKIIKQAMSPPEILFHGTAHSYIDSIKRGGLLPQQRQYVHLSSDVETAMQVGKRRDEYPLLLRARAVEAWNEGVRFYKGNDLVWLADSIPSKFIDF